MKVYLSGSWNLEAARTASSARHVTTALYIFTLYLIINILREIIEAYVCRIQSLGRFGRCDLDFLKSDFRKTIPIICDLKWLSKILYFYIF